MTDLPEQKLLTYRRIKEWKADIVAWQMGLAPTLKLQRKRKKKSVKKIFMEGVKK
jgi:hypothetical protein